MEITEHVENEIFGVIRKMMGANNSDMTATTHQSDKYYIDDDYMSSAVDSSSYPGKIYFRSLLK